MIFRHIIAVCYFKLTKMAHVSSLYISYAGRHMQAGGTAYASRLGGICKPTGPHLAAGMSMRKMRHE